MSSEVLVALIFSVIGGLLVAIVNNLFSRKKNDVETKKILAETEKTKVETRKLVTEIERLSEKVDGVATALRPNSKLIYNSKDGIQPFDFKGYPVDANNKVRLTIESDFLSVERDLVGCGYMLVLNRYNYENRLDEVLSKNDLLTRKRKIHVSLEAKITKGQNKVHFYFAPKSKSNECLSGFRVDEWKENEWVKLDFQFEFDPSIPAKFIVYVFGNTHPSSFLLRNFVLTEWSMSN